MDWRLPGSSVTLALSLEPNSLYSYSSSSIYLEQITEHFNVSVPLLWNGGSNSIYWVLHMATNSNDNNSKSESELPLFSSDSEGFLFVCFKLSKTSGGIILPVR